MYETADLIMVGLLAAFIGLAIGVGLHRAFGSSASQLRQLEKRLDQARTQGESYKAHVTEHFSETAGLLTELTMKYKDIHDHLAKGADQLCRDDQGNSLLPVSPLELRIEQKQTEDGIEETAAAVAPPLDYAPKNGDSNAGQLSEEFGLEKVKLNDDVVTNPVPGAFAASENFAGAYQDNTDTEPAKDKSGTTG